MITRHPVRLLLFVCSLLCCYHCSVAQQEDNYIIQKRLLSVEDGLTSRDVICAAQDAQGFMWFATSKGLQRYDGYHFTNFSYPEIKDRVVTAMEAFGDYLILCTYSYGKSAATEFVVDTRKQTILLFDSVFPSAPFDPSNAFKIGHDGNTIQFLTKNPFTLWELNADGMFRERCNLYTWTIPSNEFYLNNSSVHFDEGRAILHAPENSDIYLVTNNTCAILTGVAILGTPLSIHKNLLISVQHQNINNNSIAHYYTFDENTGACKQIDPNKTPQLNTNYSSIGAEIAFGSIAAGSADQGFQLFIAEESITLYPQEEYKQMTPLGVRTVFADNQNNYWICCSNGLLHVSLRKNNFKTHLAKKQTRANVPSETRGICEFQGSVYANVWDRLWRVEEFPTYSIPLNGIGYGMTTYNGELITGAIDGQQINIARKTTSNLFNMDKEIWSLFSVNDSILLAGHSMGLEIFNSKTGKLQPISSSNLNVAEPIFTYRIVKSLHNELVAAGDNGIYILNDHFEFTDYYGKLASDNLHRICSEQVYDLYEEPNGDWWIATNGEGLIHLHWRGASRSEGFDKEVFNQSSGLPSDVLYRIEHDTADNLWISTYNGLVCFNSNTHTTKTYSEADGISNNEFDRISSLSANDGRMYFGTIDGIVEFNPAALTASNKTIATPLQLTAISKLDVGADTLISCMDEFASMKKIVLQTHEKSLTLQFALLDFSFSQHHYAYMIEGLDNDWNYISENYVRLNGLPYGTYGIRIKAQQADGTWSEKELLIPVTVIAPLYARIWFYPIVIFALGILFFAFMRLRTRKLLRDKTKLENIVKKRTATLNNALNDKDVLLKEIHHRVKNNLQVIAGLLQLQKVSLQDEHAITAINESQMRVNSIALIHQNMYQQENLEEIDFQHFLRDLFKNLKSLYEQEQKQLTFDLNAEGIALDIDTAVPLGLITNELLTNTYKHAFAQSTHVTAKLILRKLNADEYELTYSDSGPGIPADFNIEQSESLGMQLLQGLSQQLMGTLRYRSGVNHAFTIVFKNAEARKRS